MNRFWVVCCLQATYRQTPTTSVLFLPLVNLCSTARVYVRTAAVATASEIRIATATLWILREAMHISTINFLRRPTEYAPLAIVCSLDSPPRRLPQGPPNLARAVRSLLALQTETDVRIHSLTGTLSDVGALDHRCPSRGLAKRYFIDYSVFFDDCSTVCAIAIACRDIVLDNAFTAVKADHLKSIHRQERSGSVGLDGRGLTFAETVEYRVEGCAVVVELLRIGPG